MKRDLEKSDCKYLDSKADVVDHKVNASFYCGLSSRKFSFEFEWNSYFFGYEQSFFPQRTTADRTETDNISIQQNADSVFHG